MKGKVIYEQINFLLTNVCSKMCDTLWNQAGLELGEVSLLFSWIMMVLFFEELGCDKGINEILLMK